MASIQDLLSSGKVQLSDRRRLPRFRFRGPIRIIAVDVVGAIVPTDVPGWTTDLSAEGAVLTVQKKLTTKGLFVQFAECDELVMPATITRTISESAGFNTYAVHFAASFDTEQILRILSHKPETDADGEAENDSATAASIVETSERESQSARA